MRRRWFELLWDFSISMSKLKSNQGIYALSLTVALGGQPSWSFVWNRVMAPGAAIPWLMHSAPSFRTMPCSRTLSSLLTCTVSFEACRISRTFRVHNALQFVRSSYCLFWFPLHKDSVKSVVRKSSTLTEEESRGPSLVLCRWYSLRQLQHILGYLDLFKILSFPFIKQLWQGPRLGNKLEIQEMKSLSSLLSPIGASSHIWLFKFKLKQNKM